MGVRNCVAGVIWCHFLLCASRRGGETLLKKTVARMDRLLARHARVLLRQLALGGGAQGWHWAVRSSASFRL